MVIVCIVFLFKCCVIFRMILRLWFCIFKVVKMGGSFFLNFMFIMVLIIVVMELMLLVLVKFVDLLFVDMLWVRVGVIVFVLLKIDLDNFLVVVFVMVLLLEVLGENDLVFLGGWGDEESLCELVCSVVVKVFCFDMIEIF